MLLVILTYWCLTDLQTCKPREQGNKDSVLCCDLCLQFDIWDVLRNRKERVYSQYPLDHTTPITWHRYRVHLSVSDGVIDTLPLRKAATVSATTTTHWQQQTRLIPIAMSHVLAMELKCVVALSWIRRSGGFLMFHNWTVDLVLYTEHWGPLTVFLWVSFLLPGCGMRQVLKYAYVKQLTTANDWW